MISYICIYIYETLKILPEILRTNKLSKAAGHKINILRNKFNQEGERSTLKITRYWRKKLKKIETTGKMSHVRGLE